MIPPPCPPEMKEATNLGALATSALFEVAQRGTRECCGSATTVD
jgi:hypothetical protein